MAPAQQTLGLELRMRVRRHRSRRGALRDWLGMPGAVHVRRAREDNAAARVRGSGGDSRRSGRIHLELVAETHLLRTAGRRFVRKQNERSRLVERTAQRVGIRRFPPPALRYELEPQALRLRQIPEPPRVLNAESIDVPASRKRCANDMAADESVGAEDDHVSAIERFEEARVVIRSRRRLGGYQLRTGSRRPTSSAHPCLRIQSTYRSSPSRIPTYGANPSTDCALVVSATCCSTSPGRGSVNSGRRSSTSRISSRRSQIPRMLIPMP